jgi:aspartate kinase
VSILLCLDNKEDKIERLATSAAEIFDVQVEKGLTLLTIRHYTESLLAEMTKGKTIELRQQSPDTIQVLLK